MDVTILNKDLDAVSIVDTYESFIWTDRYYKYGDFELYEAMRDGLLEFIQQDYYLQSRDSEHVMIIEKIQISSDTEEGNHVTVTGVRSNPSWTGVSSGDRRHSAGIFKME